MRANFVWLATGTAIHGGCQWGMLVALARLGTPELLGRFVLGYAISLPIVLFFNLHLRQVQAGDARGEFSFRDYLGLRLATTPAALAGIFAVALLGGYPADTALVIVGIGLVKSVDAISDAFHGLFQRRERMDRIAISMIARGVLALLALLAVIRAGGDLGSAVWAQAAAMTFVLLLYDVPAGRRTLGRLGAVAPHWRRRTLVALLRLSLPLGIAVLLMTVVLQLPQYLVERLLGEAALGVFAAMYYAVFAGALLVTALGESVYPRLSQLLAAGALTDFRALLTRSLALALGIGFALVALAALAGRPFLATVYGTEYAAHAGTFVWLCAAGGLGFVATVLSYAVMASRRFGIFVIPYLVLALLTFSSQFWAIGRAGLAGSAWALLLVNGFAVLLLAVIVARILRSAHGSSSLPLP